MADQFRSVPETAVDHPGSTGSWAQAATSPPDGSHSIMNDGYKRGSSADTSSDVVVDADVPVASHTATIVIALPRDGASDRAPARERPNSACVAGERRDWSSH